MDTPLKPLELSEKLAQFAVAKEIRLEPELAIGAAVQDILLSIGEDPGREGLLRTPERVAHMYGELTAGYDTDPVKLVNGAIFAVDNSEMVLVRDIEFYSLCEHHMLPFFGRAHVAYLPAGKVIGLSKIPRIVEMYARRLQLQERLTSEVAQFLQQAIQPRGVAVLLEGQHMCAMMRGVKKSQASMVTSAFLGEFQTNHALKEDFMAQISLPRSFD
ncbi:MAG: GTP cyclohydrolase I FolE [Anaerolineales bacterium]|jgi:GTP cyclohydrolase I|nr:GTP cyclohydrolase I FolE [Anaerolineales bacterium]